MIIMVFVFRLFQEMQGQCAVFLLAGYETTSTAMAFLTYELAMNPGVQDKLSQEIEEYFPDKVRV